MPLPPLLVIVCLLSLAVATQSASQNNFQVWRSTALWDPSPPTFTNASYVTSSANGSIVLAAFHDDYLFESSDYGYSFRRISALGKLKWSGVACNGNCSTVYACANPGFIYRSDDYGSTWISLPHGVASWGGIATNSLGSFLAVGDQSTSVLYFSTDFGNTLTVQSPAPVGAFSFSMSKNGEVVVAVDSLGRLFRYKSGTWTNQPSLSSPAHVALSDDGNFVILGTSSGLIYRSFDAAATRQTVSMSQVCNAVAVSGDGSRVFLGPESNFMYVSTDFGSSFSAKISSSDWTAVSSSSNGTFAIAISLDGVFRSTSSATASPTSSPSLASGASRSPTYAAHSTAFVPRAYAFNRTGVSFGSQIAPHIGMTYDGSHMAVALVSSSLQLSDDYGMTWETRLSETWSGLGASSDGSYLVAATATGPLYMLNSSGLSELPTKRKWTSVAVSSDGSRIVATESSAAGGGGYIFVSYDYGLTMFATAPYLNEWQSSTISADGTRMAACASTGGLYVSGDSGVNWDSVDSGTFLKVAMSKNGEQIAACTSQSSVAVSFDFGVTVFRRSIRSIPSACSSIAFSPNGAALFVTLDTNFIYFSRDLGISWTITGELPESTIGFAVSFDANRIVAISPNFLYFGSPTAYSLGIFNVTSASTDISFSVDRTVFTRDYIYCAAFASSDPITIARMKLAPRLSVPAEVTSFDYKITGLAALRQYFIHCYAEPEVGEGMSLSAVLSTRVAASTACCHTVDFTSGPDEIVLGDTNALIVFSFRLSSRPAVNITVHPVINDKFSGTNYVEAHPASLFFDSASASLSGSFLISNMSFGSYNALFSIDGASASDFLFSSLSFKIIDPAMPVIGPAVSRSIFSPDGASVSIVFDRPTDRLNLTSPKFPCELLLNFQENALCYCVWTSDSAIKITFPNDFDITLVKPDENLSVRSDLLRSKCFPGSTCLFGISSSRGILQPETTIPPVIIFETVQTASTCDNLTIDVSSSYGHGGRSWSVATWSVRVPLDASVSIPRILGYLKSDPDSLAKPMIIPSYLLNVTGVYTFTLTLGNFVFASSIESFSVSVVSAAIPSLLILGKSFFKGFKVSDALMIRTKASSSSCAGNSDLLITWRVYSNGTLLNSVNSFSQDPRVFQLPPYFLAANTEYSFIVSASSTSAPAVIAKDSISIFVVSGDVVARIAGGSSLNFGRDYRVILDASPTYDESSATPTLSYSWSCKVITESSLTFGDNCQTLIGSPSLKITSVAPFSLTAQNKYLFSLMVSASDGRSAFASITVNVSPSIGGPTAQISYADGGSYNMLEDLSLDGVLGAPSETRATWSSNILGYPPTFLNLTASTRIFPANSQPAAFPFLANKNMFIPGFEYAFSLFAVNSGSASKFSSSSVTVTVNGPPTSGRLTSLPLSGLSLVDMFTIYTYGWIDPDLPIEYKFGCKKGTSDLSLSSKSFSTFLETTLPSGDKNNGDILTVYLIASDSYAAESILTLNITVSSSPNTAIGGSGFLDLVSSRVALFKDDFEKIWDVCNVFVGEFAADRCVDAPNCTTLNRSSCDSQSPMNKCGACLNGFISADEGIRGNCYAYTGTAFTCSDDSDCRYRNCDRVSGVCKVPSKKCSSSTCSGNGKCGFTDSSGSSVSECIVSNPYCSAKCVCSNDYGGEDCSIPPSSRASRDSFITLMCNTFLSTLLRQQPTTAILETAASSLSLIFDPDQVQSSAGISACGYLFSNISSLVAQGYLKGASTSTFQNLFFILSKFASVPKRSSSSSSSASLSLLSTQSPLTLDLSDAVNDLSSGMVDSLSDGQSSLTFLSDNFVVTAYAPLLTELFGATLTPPSLSSDSSVISPSIHLPSSGLDLCGSNTGFKKFYIAQWVKNPYKNTSKLATPIIRFYSDSVDTLPNANVSASNFSMVLPFSSIPVYDPVTKTFANNTLPTCVKRSGNNFVPCSCNLVSFTNTTATFNCDSVSLLCSTSSSRRRLSGGTYSSSTEYASFYENIEDTIVITLSSKPVVPSIVVTVLVSILILLFLVGIIYFHRWDLTDRALILNALTTTNLNDDATESERIALYKAYQHKTGLQRLVEFKINLRDGMFMRFFKGISTEHVLIYPFIGASLSRSRLVRFVAFAKGVLFDLFWDTVLFGIIYPVNHGCEKHITQATCIEGKVGLFGGPLCDWDASSGCALAPPKTDFLYILILAILISSLSLPCNALYDALIYFTIARRPQLELFGLRSDRYFGPRISTPGMDALSATVEFDAVTEKVKADMCQYGEDLLLDYEFRNLYIEAMVAKLGLKLRGNRLTVSSISYFFYGGTVESRIKEYVFEAYEKALIIQNSLLEEEELDADRFGLSNLLLHFVAEFLEGNGKNMIHEILLQTPSHYEELSHPLPWALGVVIFSLSIIFVFYWILVWGTQNGDALVRAWGLNYAATFFYSLLVVEALKFFCYFALSLEFFRPKIRALYGKIREDAAKLYESNSRIMHNLSPSCIAAGFEQNLKLKSAMMLKALNDTNASHLVAAAKSQCLGMFDKSFVKTFQADEYSYLKKGDKELDMSVRGHFAI